MARRRETNSTPISLFSFQDIITSITGIMVLVTLIMTLELIQRKLDAPAVQTAKIVKELQPAVAQQDQEIAQLEEQLAREAETLNELAGIDPTQAQREMGDLERLTEQLRKDAQALRSQEAAADSRLRRTEAEKARRASDADTIKDLTERARKAKEQLEALKNSNRVIYNVSSDVPKSAWLVEIGEDKILAAPAGKRARATVFSGAAWRDEFVRWAGGRDSKSEYFMMLVKPGGVDTFSPMLAQLRQAGFQVGFDLIAAEMVAVDPETGASPR